MPRVTSIKNLADFNRQRSQKLRSVFVPFQSIVNRNKFPWLQRTIPGPVFDIFVEFSDRVAPRTMQGYCL